MDKTIIGHPSMIRKLALMRGWLLPDGTFVKVKIPVGAIEQTHGYSAYKILNDGENPPRGSTLEELDVWEDELIRRGAVRFVDGLSWDVPAGDPDALQRAIDHLLDVAPEVIHADPGWIEFTIDVRSIHETKTYFVEPQNIAHFKLPGAKRPDAHMQRLWQRKAARERGAEKNPMGDVEKRAKAMQKRIVADIQKMTGPQHRIHRDGRFILLTTEKDELLGAMDLAFAPPSSVYLALIVVLPEHRNMGYATLMMTMLTAAADMNMWTIKGVIRPWAGHGEAKKPMGLRTIRAWYRRLGFEVSQDDEITRYPQGLMKPR